MRPRERSRLAVLVTALALALGGLAATGGTSVAAERAVAPTVSPLRPMVGERTTFSGALRGPGRPVALQRRTGGSWQTVAKGRVSKANRYSLRHRVTRTATYRVTAKRYRGKRAFTSGRRAVRVIGQQVNLDLTATPFVLDLQRTVRAAVSPVRTGREVVLQRKVGSGSWTNVVVRRTNSAGVASLPHTASSLGPALYRAIARSYRGSSAKGSATSVVAGVRTTALLSPGLPSAGEARAVSISPDGRWVGLTARDPLLPSDTDNDDDAYLFDRRTGTLELLVPHGDDDTTRPLVSANGRFVAFQSRASNLLPGPPEADSDSDVFVLDRTTGVVELVSETAIGDDPAGGSFVSAISDDGQLIAFTSTANTLVLFNPPPDTFTRHAYLRDRDPGVNVPLDKVSASVWADVAVTGVDLSADGSAVVFASGDQDLHPGAVDESAIFRWTIKPDGTRETGIGLVNLTPHRTAYSPSISGNGDVLAFESPTTLGPGDTNDQVDSYVTSDPDTYTYLGQAGWNLATQEPSISDDGRYVAFESENVVEGDNNIAFSDIFVIDLLTHQRRLVTTPTGTGLSADPLLSRGGSIVTFSSAASGLVPEPVTGDWNAYATVLR